MSRVGTTPESDMPPSQPRPRGAIPVQEKERIQVVDIIRGFAVFGILVANMVSFSGQHGGLMTWEPWPDRAVVFLTEFLVRAKFYTLFSFLFGWGMSIQLQRAEARGANFLPVYLRRLLVLLVFGVLHGWFIWSGDILTFYALCGFILVLFRHRSNRLVLSLAVLLLLFTVYLNSPLDSAESLRVWYGETTAALRWNTQTTGYYFDGTYQDTTAIRFQEFIGSLSLLIYYFGPVFSMFLLGMVWGKGGYFREAHEHKRFYTRLLWVSLPLGLLLNGFFAATRVWNDLGWPEWLPEENARIFIIGTRTIGAPLLMLAYVSAITLLFSKPDWRSRLMPLAPVGRMALTNYLMQSVIATLIFYPYGLGLYGEFSPAFGLVITLLIYSSQIRFSHWWLERYQFGPVEWLWRTLSYRQRPPYRHGDTYENVRSSRLVRRLREVPSTYRLVAAWVVLIVWAVVLYSGYRDLGGPSRTVSLAGGAVEADGPNIPDGSALPDGSTSVEPEIVVTPDVRPVNYDPGPLAAAGDTLGLAQQFDPQRALEHIAALSGEPIFGRYAGTTQGYAAGDYIAAQFESFGLQPAGENGEFFQPFPFAFQNLAAVPTFVVTDANGTRRDDYRLHEDYSALGSAYLGGGQAEGSVFWANNCLPEDFYDADVTGKIVLCRLRSSLESGRFALEHGAVGLLLLSDVDSAPLSFGLTYRDTWLQETIPALRVSRQIVEDILNGSGFTVDDLTLRFDSFDIDARVQMEVDMAGEEACAVQPCQGRNVLGVIPGRNPEFRDEVVMIGAHYDHLGQSPDGVTAWPGANDNASGVAVLLEIARSWQAEGYVPNRTVVFAAWDAEEEGLIGSRFYVDHPQYPLDKTVYVLNLDMVGAGEQPLFIGGSSGFEPYLTDIADLFDVPTRFSDSGGSDHASFVNAGVSANLLIWDFSTVDVHYHEPGDTVAGILPERLQQVGQIASLALLGFSEGAADIRTLVQERAQAVLDGDREAFLATSSAARQTSDRVWFDDIQTYDPLEFEYQIGNLSVVGSSASAQVSLRLAYPDEDGIVPEEGGVPRSNISSQFSARFEKENGSWKWAGINLQPVLQPVSEDAEELPEEGLSPFNVFVPSSLDYLAREEDEQDPPEFPVTRLGRLAAEQYAYIAEQLGLPGEISASILLYPDLASLRADSAMAAAEREAMWVQPGVIKLVYSEDIYASSEFQAALVWLLLAEAGVEPQAAPWLWNGLPAAIESSVDLQGVQSRFLPRLARDLAEDTIRTSETSGWAAVEFLRLRSGWTALGNFVLDLGGLCRQGSCQDERALDSALGRQYRLSAAGFEDAWKTYWTTRLADVQGSLDAVLADRMQAVIASDRASFLATVDRNAGTLFAEQEHWFDGLRGVRLTSFQLTAEPITIFDNGDILANVSTDYSSGVGGGSNSGTSLVLFKLRSGRLFWAGESLEVLRGVLIDVYYPHGMEEIAASVRQEAEDIASKTVEILGVRLSSRLQVKLYRTAVDFRSSVALSFPQVEWVNGWTGRGESVKLLVSDFQPIEEIHPILATYISKQLLHQMGIETEWLLQGAASYIARDLQNSLLQYAAVGNLWRVAYRAENENLPSLTEFPAEFAYESYREWGIATSYAWDVLRYIGLTFGEDRMWDFVRLIGRGQSTEQAVQNALGLSLDELLSTWKESIARAHVDERWVELMGTFDVERAEELIDILSAPDLEGRQAGSPGALSTAEYIAGLFEQYGLQPLVPLPPAEELPTDGEPASDGESPQLPEQETLSYLQYFPIQYATLQWTPSLTFSQPDGTLIDSFDFRSDFGLALNASPVGGVVEAEMVWILNDYDDMQLSGKIAVRRSQDPIADELAAAVEHGAAGLILIRDREIQKGRDLMDKKPMPLDFNHEAAIPVVLLGSEGYIGFQEIVGLTPIDLGNSPPALPLGIHARIEIPLSEPAAGVSANVLGFLPGTDPDYQDEIIIVGAHYDHVGDDPDTLLCSGEPVSLEDFDPRTCERIPGFQYTGRNDDASGVAVMLEVLRMWHENGYQPRRSVLFAAWGAQEANQAGSRYFINNNPIPIEDINAVVQLDSVAGGRGYYLLAQGVWDTEGLMLYGIDTANTLYDGRLTITKESEASDHWTFLELDIPSLLVSWDEAADIFNWPDEMADEVQSYRLNIAGQLFGLMLVSLAY